jgi:YVTN family beta-propeller protein
VEALNTTTIRRLIPSARHQLPAIARTEPRGCALTADGSLLYIANHTEGTVSIVDTSSRTVAGTVQLGSGVRPFAVAIADTGSIATDTVFVTDAFAELNPDFNDPTFDGNGEARDLGKQGVVYAFPAGNASPPIKKITLKPLEDSGFTANLITPNNFCGAAAHSLIFCPDPNDPTDPMNMAAKQGVFPNQLLSGLIRGDRLFLPNIGSQPQPPEFFNTNVQALVYVVDVDSAAERANEHVNLNQQIAVETAQPPPSLDRTFGNDLVAIDGNAAGDTFLIVSRGGNQVFRAKLDASGKLNILNAAADHVDCRVQTGNLPSGVAMRKDGTRGYANNKANFSVTSMNVADGTCLTQELDISSSEPPAPGSFQHNVLVGKVAFFTALGIPDNGFQGTDIRDIIPRNFKFTCTGATGSLTIKYLEKVGTFDPNDPIEIRDNAAAAIALGADGFNVPSLLSINYSAPYLHRGQAQTLEEVFPLHGLGPDGENFPPMTTIANTLTPRQTFLSS